MRQSLESVQFSHVIGGSVYQDCQAARRIGLVKVKWPTCACSTGVQVSIMHQAAPSSVAKESVICFEQAKCVIC